jgi:hypothetical protein
MQFKIYLVQMHEQPSLGDRGFCTIAAFSTKSSAEAFLEAFYEEACQDPLHRAEKERNANGDLVVQVWYVDGVMRHWIQTIELN